VEQRELVLLLPIDRLQPARTCGAAKSGAAAACREVVTCKNLWSSGELVLLLTGESLHPAICKNLWSSGELELLLTVERLNPATCKMPVEQRGTGNAADCREVASCNL
jgi:hypothetical protein